MHLLNRHAVAAADLGLAGLHSRALFIGQLLVFVSGEPLGVLAPLVGGRLVKLVDQLMKVDFDGHGNRAFADPYP